VKFHVGNVDVRVEGATLDDERWLREYLAISDAGAKYRARFRKSGDGRIQLFNLYRHTFPTGLLPTVRRGMAEVGLAAEVVDERTPPCAPDPRVDLSWLRDYQLAAFRACVEHGRGVVKAGTGCHARGQLVLSYDGRLQRIEDVRLDDLLMGPDGKPRHVLQLHAGRSPLVEVTPTKGAPFVVTPNHLLTVVQTNNGPCHHKTNGTISDVRVDTIPKRSAKWKHLHKLFRVAVDFPTVPELRISPYFMGVLLGDGSLSPTVRVTTEDSEIERAIRQEASDWLLRVSVDRGSKRSQRTPTYAIVGKRGARNPLVEELQRLRLWGLDSGAKFIPYEYKTASRTGRLELLAGLFDTDGHNNKGAGDYISKSSALAEDFAFVARSLGFAAYVAPCQKRDQHGHGGTYHRVSLSGDLSRIPLRVPHKAFDPRRQKKNVLRTGFSLRSQAPGEFYGVTVDGDGHYLLGDFTVTHNSGKTEVAIALVRSIPCRWLLLVHRTSLVQQAAERYALRTGDHAGVVAEGEWNDRPRFVCATYQSILAGLRDTGRHARTEALLKSFGGVVCDECHTVPAKTCSAILRAMTNAWHRIGLSATPLDRTDQRSIFAVAALGPVIHSVPAATLIEAGVLAQPEIHLVTHEHSDEGGGGLYADVYTELVVQNERRTTLVVDTVLQAQKPAFVFVQRVEHGRILTDALNAAGVRAEFAWGHLSTEQRSGIVRRLVAQEIDACVTSVVFQEGIDVPELRSVVNAAAGKSIIAALQRIGRGMRRSEGKTTFEVWDVVDVGQKWLAKHSRARVRAYKREGLLVEKRGSREQVQGQEELGLDSPARMG
jgi:superfamily II DNA or RNA helicase